MGERETVTKIEELSEEDKAQIRQAGMSEKAARLMQKLEEIQEIMADMTEEERQQEEFILFSLSSIRTKAGELFGAAVEGGEVAICTLLDAACDKDDAFERILKAVVTKRLMDRMAASNAVDRIMAALGGDNGRPN